MSASFDFAAPEHFAAGAVGEPGQRTFYLQAREGAQLITLKVEKEHVGALADYLAGLLVQLSATPDKAAEAAELVEPLEAVWDVGAIAIRWKRSSGAPTAWATAALMGSACDTATTVPPR